MDVEQNAILQPEQELQPEGARRRGLSGNTLKTIAIVAMLIDHIAHVFVPYGGALYLIMRTIGRITGPVMFYMVAEGFYYTRNKNKYMLRLALFAAISYLPFILCFSGWTSFDTWQGFVNFNVIYTIFLGVCALRLRHSNLNPVMKWGGIVLMVALSLFGDWAISGVVIIVLFDYFRGDFKKQAFAYCLVIFMQSTSILAYPVYVLLGYYESFDWSMYASILVNLGMFIPIFLLQFYNGKKGSGGALAKYGFYIFYPGHLLILYLIQTFAMK